MWFIYFTIYYYKWESVNDLNCGCAWRSMQTVLKYLLNKSKSEWAEPFISQLILYDFRFNGYLFLVNGYPKQSFVLKNVFEIDS